jgi:hypothetical protein
MIATTPHASWDLDSMNMIPTINDLPRAQLDVILTEKFPSNAEHSILEAVFGADEHVTLALSREMGRAMRNIQAQFKFEPKDEHQKQAQEALVVQIWNGMKSFIKQELQMHLQLGIVQWWKPEEDHLLRVDCDDTMNPPSVLDAGKLVAVVTIASGKVRSNITIFHFVFDRYSMIEALLKNGIDAYMKDLAASRPQLFEVICDRTNNSDEDIANGHLHVDIKSSDPEIIKAMLDSGLAVKTKE